MKVGAESKKVVILAGLLSVAAVLLYQQFVAAPGSPSAAAPARSAPLPSARSRAAVDDVVESRAAPRSRPASRAADFKPSLKAKRPGEGPDPTQIDPTLRTDLLAKVQAVNFEGVERNLFQFGARKPKVTPEQIEAAKKEAAAAAEKAVAPPPPPAKPADPVAPPINMEYYGYASDGRRRGMLKEGEELYIVAEGDVIKKRYRVVRIGINSIVMEDVQFKSQQTLALKEN